MKEHDGGAPVADRPTRPEADTVRLPARYESPLYFLIVVVISAFVAQGVVTLLVAIRTLRVDPVEAVFDSLVTILAVVPIVYAFLFRPLTHNIAARKELEEHIEESLDRREREVRTTTEIAQHIAAFPALEDLFREVVNLVQQRFGYYHVHIYLLQARRLIMQEGTGEAGRKIKEDKHEISLSADKSLVARSARTGEAVLVPDVSEDSGWLPNPHLPDTKSELAVPIKMGGAVLGVLDVQSNVLGGLDEEDKLLLIGLCGQIAVAIDDRRAEEALRTSEEGFRLAFENATDAIFWADADTGIIANCNRAAEALLEKPKDEIIGQHHSTLHPAAKAEYYAGVFGRHAATNQAAEEEAEVVTKTGKTKPVHITASVTLVGGKRILQGIFRDMTEHKQMEEEVWKTRKLEAIGLLAGGIAHDFNNILTGILGNITLAKLFARPEDPIYEKLTGAEKTAWRAKHLTQQLLTFAKGDTPVKEVADLRDLVSEAAGFALGGKRANCEYSLPEDLWAVDADRWQITQVISNLLTNAHDAMPEGTIRVRAENVIVDASHPVGTLSGAYVRLSVTDQGPGIPKEHLSKVFDPYFTTKDKASGFGLSISYSLVKKHGGHIAIESEPGTGTTATIYLPASEQAAPKKAAKEEAKAAAIAKGLRVLVMDDEEIVRSVSEGFLAHLGCEAVLAKDGAEAVSLFQRAREGGKPFDVVILDLTVPEGMGAAEAVKKLLDLDPNVKAILSSGYSNDPLMVEFRKHGFRGTLTKPYEITQIEDVLRKVTT